MLLPSGNDAANAAGVRLYGSIEGFVQAMNQRAQELGLHNTHYVTACGLDAEGTIPPPLTLPSSPAWPCRMRTSPSSAPSPA